MSTVTRTWGELGESLCVDDLVVAADHLLRRFTVARIRAALATRGLRAE